MEQLNEVKPIEKAWHWTGYATLGIGMYFLLYYLWFAYFPMKILDAKSPIPVLHKTVQAGDEVGLVLDFCKYKDYNSTIHKNIIGKDIVFTLPTTESRFPKGCRKVTQFHKISESLPSGEYYIDVHISYYINQYRTVEYKLVSEKFTVINEVFTR